MWRSSINPRLDQHLEFEDPGTMRRRSQLGSLRNSDRRVVGRHMARDQSKNEQRDPVVGPKRDSGWCSALERIWCPDGRGVIDVYDHIRAVFLPQLAGNQ